MISRSSITRHRRLVALSGIALVSVPLVLAPAIHTGHARSAELAPVTRDANAPASSLADIVQADKPAVVTVTTMARHSGNQANGLPQFGPGSLFDEFFRQFFGQNGPGTGPMAPNEAPSRPELTEGLGSGFIIDGDGTIVTNNHVVEGATEIEVTLDDGTKLPATVLGTDSKTDLAVLKIDAGKPLPSVSWGNSDRLRAGDGVVAIGNPFGIGTTATSGIVSARGRDLHNGPYDDFLQVDAAINLGNSGGPLIDMEGRVIGINTAIYSPNGGNVGVGFAIPSNDAQGVVAALIKNGSIAHGYLGVSIQPVTQDIATALGLKDAKGALVASVQPNSPAASADIKPGDVIVSLNGADVAAPHDLSRGVADLEPGAAGKLTIWRDGARVDLNVTVGDENTKTAAARPTASPKEEQQSDLGLGLAANPEGTGAVVASVDPDKAAAGAGLREGDVIIGVNQKAQATPGDVAVAIREAAKSGRGSVLLQVERDGEQVFVAVPFARS